MSTPPLVKSWRAANEPVAAHALAEHLLSEARYAHTRGVAQQAARLATLTRQPAASRRLLLCAAWLHDLGYGLGDGFHPIVGARALRAAGHERLARIVAHHSGADMEAALRDLPPIGREFPFPGTDDGFVLTLLDASDVTTGSRGERVDPWTRLRDLVARRGADSPAVRVFVSTVDRLSQDATIRDFVATISGPRQTTEAAA